MLGISLKLRAAWANAWTNYASMLLHRCLGIVAAATIAGIASASAQTFTLTIQPNTLPPATQGVPYSQPITAVGGNSNYALVVGSGTLPTGLLLTGGAGSWTLSGTPSGSGAFNFRIDATDIDGNTGFRPYTFNTGTAGGMTVNPPTLPNGFINTAYSQNITGSGGTGPYTFVRTAGTLPTGLTLTSGGLLSGTPTVGGPFTFTVQGTDFAGNTDTATYTVHIGTNSLTVLPASLPNGSLTVPYNQTVTASGGSGAGQVFSITAGSLPNGLSMNAGGNITGTPTVAGPFTFTVGVVDSFNNTGSRAYTVTIGSNILTVTPPTQPGGTVGTPYSQTFGATGGTGGPYTFARTSGALPNGLALSAGGTLSGTPSASGTFNFDVTATDGNFNTGTRSYSVTISLAPLTVNPPTLASGTAGTPYGQNITASGGSGNYSFAVLSGALPTGLSMNGAGAITGTPTVSGAFNFTVQATDNTTPNTGTRNYTINIGTANSLTVTPPTLPNGTQNTPYSQTVSTIGATGSVSFALVSGALPAGLSISSGGVISGTPSGSGPSTFTVGATDSIGNTGSQLYTINIGTSVLTVTPPSLPAGTRNVAYSQNVGATGGTGGPYIFTISGGALPAGVTMNSAGLISGTPTVAGSTSFTVRALDTLGNFGTRLYNVNIGTITLTINPVKLADAVSGRPYSQTIVASGGTGPYTYSIITGALPPGLTLNGATGVISGTSTGTGIDNFTVQAVDSNGNTGSRVYTLDPRPDPAQDPEVQGLILAQVAAAQRFALAQVNNVARHLEGLHSNFNPCSFNFGLAPQIDAMQQQPGAPYGSYQNPNALYSPYGNYGQPPMQPPPAPANCAADWAVWTSGAFQFGSLTPTGTSVGNNFTTAGVTGGADYRVTETLIVGGAVGYGADRSIIGQNGTRSDSSSFTGAVYASLKLFEPLFLDGSIGYGTLGYDNQRFVTGDSTTATGTRKGSYWFGSLAASLELGRGRVKFAPYLSTDFMSATLDGYSESGPSDQLLTYNSTKFNAVSGAVGLRGSIDIPTGFGTFTPTARGEYRQVSQGAFDQSMYYSDLGPGLSSTFSQAAANGGMATGALGFRARSHDGLGVEVEYGLTQGPNSARWQSVRASVKMAF